MNRLNLTSELRFHFAADVHRFIEALLQGGDPKALRPIAERLHEQQFRFLLTRDLDTAERYVCDRYPDAPLARYGILASSKDKFLPRFGVDNTYQMPKTLREGPWYNSDPRDLRSRACLTDPTCTTRHENLVIDFTSRPDAPSPSLASKPPYKATS